MKSILAQGSNCSSLCEFLRGSVLPCCENFFDLSHSFSKLSAYILQLILHGLIIEIDRRNDRQRRRGENEAVEMSGCRRLREIPWSNYKISRGLSLLSLVLRYLLCSLQKLAFTPIGLAQICFVFLVYRYVYQF